MTPESLATEFWAHYYDARPDGEEIEDEDFDLEAELEKMKRGDSEDVK